MSRRRKVNRISNNSGAKGSPSQKRATMEDIEKMPAFLDTAQAASIIGETPIFVAKLCSSEEIPAVKCGREWRINKTRFLQQFGLVDDDIQQEESDMNIQESIPIDQGNFFDLSGAIAIKNGHGRGVVGDEGSTYIILTTNGTNGGTRKKTEAVSLSLRKKDADLVISRYGERVSVQFVRDLSALAITTGSARAIAKNGKSKSGRRTVSVGMFRNELREVLGDNRLAYMRMVVYDNCLLFVPTGEVER